MTDATQPARLPVKVTGTKLPVEDPIRLRECLTALSQACGHDVYRCELTITNGTPRVIITCSNEAKEVDVAQMIGEALTPWLSTTLQLKLDGERYEYRIVDVCEALHMAGTGAGDGLADGLKATLIEKLKARLLGWRASPTDRELRYDLAIRELIKATLEDTDPPADTERERKAEE